MSAKTCESCGAPIKAGQHCQWCVDSAGKLQAFEERFERMLSFRARLCPELSRAQLERNTLALMAAMPAWKGHPRIKAEFPDA